MATRRPRRGSSARYTSPIPPVPISASTTYGPSGVPAGRNTGASRGVRLLPHKSRQPAAFVKQRQARRHESPARSTKLACTSFA